MAAAELRIKLLHLLPDKTTLQRFDSAHIFPENVHPVSHTPINCTISTTTLDAAPSYTALSYTWGDPTIRTPVLIDGQTVKVTTNLETALQYLRKGLTEPLTLWVDALCIDQENEAEKSEQVMHMRDIYTRAERVLTWLGAHGSALGMRWMEEFGRRAADLRIGSRREMLLRTVLTRAETQLGADAEDGNSSPTEEQVFVQDLKRGLNAELNPQYDELTAGLQDILRRPYWNRVWIVQEVTMARKITFVCGSETVTYDALHHALRLLRNFRQWQQLRLGHDTSRPALVRENSEVRAKVIATDPSHPIDLLKVSRGEGDMPMMYLLRRLQRFEATDPRDRLFALLGIITDGKELGIKADYSKSCEQVYTEFARILLHHGYFDVLSHCVYAPHREGLSLRLQSWVPCWSCKKTSSPLQQRALDRSRKPAVRTVLQPHFLASGRHRQPEPVETAKRPWDAPLEVTAIIVGQVQRMGDCWEVENIGKWLQTLLSLSHAPSARSMEPCERAHTVWRTAVADQDMRRHNDKPRLPEDTLAKLDKTLMGWNLQSVDAQLLVDNGLGQYAEELYSIGRGRRPFLTSLGALAIGPKETQTGDIVAAVLGAEVMYVLRRQGGDHSFVLIGEAYVHGCMDGEMAGPDAVVTEIELL